MANKKTVLVIGAVGFIGPYIIDECQKLGYRVQTLINRAGKPANLPEELVKLEGQLDEVASLGLPMGEVDGMILCAADMVYQENIPVSVDYKAFKNLLMGLDGRKVPVVLVTAAYNDDNTNVISPATYVQMRNCENLLRAVGLSYTVVRFNKLLQGLSKHRQVCAINIAEDPNDTQAKSPERHTLTARQAGRILAHAIHNQNAQGKSIGIFSTDGDEVTDWDGFFAAVAPDNLISDPDCGLPTTAPKLDSPPSVIDDIRDIRDHFERYEKLRAEAAAKAAAMAARTGKKLPDPAAEETESAAEFAPEPAQEGAGDYPAGES